MPQSTTIFSVCYSLKQQIRLTFFKREHYYLDFVHSAKLQNFPSYLHDFIQILHVTFDKCLQKFPTFPRGIRFASNLSLGLLQRDTGSGPNIGVTLSKFL